MMCYYWKDIRTELFEVASKLIENFSVFSPNEQFLKILSHKNEHLIYALGKFLTNVLKTDNVV